MIRNPSILAIILVFAVAIAGCTAVVSFQATRLAACPPAVVCA